MIFLDTTVLVYAVGSPHPLAAPCRRVFETIADGTLLATTTCEVVQEFAHARARRRPRDDAARLARSFAASLSPLHPVDVDDLDEGLALFEQHPRLGAFDAVLAAAARRRGAGVLVSADQAFASVPGLRHLDPASPTFVADLLSAG